RPPGRTRKRHLGWRRRFGTPHGGGHLSTPPRGRATVGIGKAGAYAVRRVFAVAGLLAAFGQPAAAFVASKAAPVGKAAPVEIPRPSRAWVPEGEPPTSESWRLRIQGGPGRLGRALEPEYSTHCGQIGVDGETVGGDDDYVAAEPTATRLAWRALTTEPGVRAEARWNGATGAPHRAWVS